MRPLSAKLLLFSTSLFLMTGCRQDQLTLPVTHAAVAQPQPAQTPVSTPARDPGALKPGSSCYAFIPLRPKVQRADAVQERLRQADEMSAALDADTVTVDLVGDHANVLSLEFPVIWPAPPQFAEQVSRIIEKYFSATEVEDNLCNAGFAAVKLSLRGVNDGSLHRLWTARVTTEGLLRQDLRREPRVEDATLRDR